MLTIDEFRAAHAHSRRTLLKWMTVTILGAMGCGLLIRLFLELYHGHFYLTRWLGAVRGEFLFQIAPAPALLAFGLGVYFAERKRTQDPRLRCPHCSKLIVDYASLVIATRNCPQCGRRVLAEPDEKLRTECGLDLSREL